MNSDTGQKGSLVPHQNGLNPENPNILTNNEGYSIVVITPGFLCSDIVFRLDSGHSCESQILVDPEFLLHQNIKVL